MTAKETSALRLRRTFNAYEESLMLRQSRSEFSMHKLEQLLKASRETIIVRMLEIGLQPWVHQRKPRAKRPAEETWRPTDGFDSAPSVGKDKLLQLLEQHHGDRRYETLSITTKKG